MRHLSLYIASLVSLRGRDSLAINKIEEIYLLKTIEVLTLSNNRIKGEINVRFRDMPNMKILFFHEYFLRRNIPLALKNHSNWKDLSKLINPQKNNYKIKF